MEDHLSLSMSNLTMNEIKPSVELDVQTLGFIKWYYETPDELVKDFPNGVVDLREEHYVKCDGILDEYIDGIGEQAITIGSSTIRFQTVILSQFDRRMEVKVLPSLPIDKGHLVDGTQMYGSDRRSLMRSFLGPRYKVDSSTLDAVMVALYHLDAGRTQNDQVAADLLADRPKPAQILLQGFRYWIHSTQEDIDALRDEVMEALITVAPAEFPPGELFSVGSIMSYLGSYTPQFWATWCCLTTCCVHGKDNWTLDADGNLRHSRNSGIFVSLTEEDEAKRSMNQILQAPFKLRTFKGAPTEEVCGRGPACGSEYQTQEIVLDRPPPTMCVINTDTALGRFSSGHSSVWQERLEPQLLRFRTWTPKGLGNLTTTYVLQSTICRSSIFQDIQLLVSLEARTGKDSWLLYDGIGNNGSGALMKEDVMEYLSRPFMTGVLFFYVRVE